MIASIGLLPFGLHGAPASENMSSIKQPFTVRDSIAWAHLISFSVAASESRATDIALFSPNRSHFILHVRRGDVEKNVNLDALLLYTTRDVESYARSSQQGEPPQPVELVSVQVAKDEDFLSGMRWLNESELGFIAKAPNGRMQAFAVNIQTRSLEQLTFSDTDVVAFSNAGTKVAYYACVPYVKQRPQIVVVKTFAETLPPMDNSESGCFMTTPIELFMGTAGQPGAQRLLPAMRLGGPDVKRIWTAPSGDYAVVLAPAVNAPPEWSAYRGPMHDQWGFTPQWVRSDPTSIDLINRYRYLLVDVRRRTSQPLLDAPSGVNSFNLTPPEVFWRKGERSVIVSNTYLPLEGVDPATRAQRQRQPAIVEVDIRSGVITHLAWEAAPPDIYTRLESPIVAFDWQSDEDQLTVIHRRTADGATTQETYRAEGGMWKGSKPVVATETGGRVAVEQREDLNERPKVYVRVGRSGPRKMLFDPNPQAERLSFGTTRILQWKDANGTAWTGGLLVPPNYVASARYPLIVQTHGFNPGRFLLDGPMYDGQGGTAFAAQAFANAGFVVLQIEDNPSTITLDDREGPLGAEGFRCGIERLIAAGVVDASRVGLIAFSRTGHPTLHLLARHPTLLAAVSMSDALMVGYAGYLFNMQGAAEAELANLTGGSPAPANVPEWFARNPMYALATSKAAIRLEEMGSGLAMWEPYAVLREAHRPADFVVYPDGSHVLQKPIERLASQGGNVDWFRFWLQDYEDPNEEKQEQYRRWRELRSLRQ